MERNDHFLCESCGSATVSEAKATGFDRLLLKMSGGKRFTCDTCGWTGLRNWSHVPAAIAHRPPASRSRTRASRLGAPSVATAIDRALELHLANSR